MILRNNFSFTKTFGQLNRAIVMSFYTRPFYQSHDNLKKIFSIRAMSTCSILPNISLKSVTSYQQPTTIDPQPTTIDPQSTTINPQSTTIDPQLITNSSYESVN